MNESTVMKQRKFDLLSLGTMYADIDFLNFPFDDGLMSHKEAVGSEYELVPGGSALNFAQLCAALKLKPVFIGKSGQDELGKLVWNLIKKKGIEPAIIQSPFVATNIAVHYVREDGVSIMTSAGSANQSISIEEVRSLFEQHLPQVKLVYFGGVFKMKRLLPHYHELALKAREAGAQVVLDHGRVNNSVTADEIALVQQLLPLVDFYLPSKDEFLDVWEADTIRTGLATVRKRCAATIVVKNSEKGAIGLANDQQPTDTTCIQVSAFPVEAHNTVGAGDSFNAGFIHANLAGHSLAQSIEFACATAATKISSPQKLSMMAIEQLFKQRH